MTGRAFHPTILRDYDIRGIVGETLFPEDARTLGLAFGSLLRQEGEPSPCVVVGRDGRLSSPALEVALVEGLATAGVAVSRVGLGPTPLLYYAAHQAKAAGAIMVTGSHNPPNHNGFKLVRGGQPFFGEDLQSLGRRAAAGGFASGSGLVSDGEGIKAAYVARLLEDCQGDNWRGARPLKVIWDAGNGATGEVLRTLIAALPGEHHLLFAEIDGRFPNHHPDPTEEKNMAALRDAILAQGADLGIAFDGDGDRMGVMDGRGRMVWGDQLLVMLAESVLAEHPGATVIADVKASQILFDEVARLGGVAVMGRSGHSLIKAKMAETGALLAGEMTGHFFFADRYFGFDDALYAALRLLSLINSWGGVTLAERFDRLPQLVNTPELRFPCPDDRKGAVVAQVKARLAAAGARVNDVDGVRVDEPDGWWLLRVSNTQAMLTARCEARDEAGLQRLRATLAGHLRACGLDLPL